MAIRPKVYLSALSVFSAALLTACDQPSNFDSSLPMRGGPARPPWMNAQAKAQDLIYVSNQGSNTVTVYSYGSRKLVGTLSGFSMPGGLCSDAAGNVWVTNEGASEVLEYAHGGSTPIATLSDGSEQPLGCSVDSKTGNVAVLNNDDVAVFTGGSGPPTLYTGGELFGDYALTYGAQGNLLIDGGSYDSGNVVAFAQLKPNAHRLQQVVLSKTLQWAPPTFVQWDGEFWVVGDSTLDWFKLSGHRGRYEGSTQLAPASPIMQLCIANVAGSGRRGNQLVATEDDPFEVQFFQYPAGGTPFAKIINGLSEPYGIAISKGAH